MCVCGGGRGAKGIEYPVECLRVLEARGLVVGCLMVLQ